MTSSAASAGSITASANSSKAAVEPADGHVEHGLQPGQPDLHPEAGPLVSSSSANSSPAWLRVPSSRQRVVIVATPSRSRGSALSGTSSTRWAATICWPGRW